MESVEEVFLYPVNREPNCLNCGELGGIGVKGRYRFICPSRRSTVLICDRRSGSCVVCE